MKIKLPILFLILSLALIGIGIFVALKNRAADQSAPMQTTMTSAPATPGIPGAQSRARQYFTVKLPDATPDFRKSYEGFEVSFNEDNRTPNWVAWELLASETRGDEARHGKFWQDEDVPGCPTTRDYSNSGYDRGHLCPAADQKWSQQAMIDCFSLANIAPQDHDLNTGAWKTLENKERQWAQRDSAIIIVAGPIYQKNDLNRVGENRVRVPSAFFKVIVAPYLTNPRGIAFVYPNMTSPGNMQQYAMSIRELEKITGYDFFSDIPRDEQDRFETSASFHDWNHR